MKYALIDTANTFFRARHIASRNSDTWEKIGMALHLTLASVNQVVRKYGIDHVVFCLEGRSWRKDYYAPYKRNRSDARAAHTEKEQDEEKVFWEAFDTFKDFITDKTNCTVLQNPQLEADDLIAGWIQTHPHDKHVIISTDTDFVQLIAPNVTQYNGVMEHVITHEGIFDDKGKAIIDKKTQEPKPAPNPEWLLFEKCMRGDTSDNVFSAYPGVRTKGTSKKVGLTEAFEDRNSKGYAWNNLMLQRWSDHNGVEHRVLEDYERNRRLIDLTHQPENIKEIITNTISSATAEQKNVTQVGIRLIKFCNLWDLKKIADQAQSYAEPLNARYTNSEIVTA